MNDLPGYLVVAPWHVTEQGGVNGVIRHLTSEMQEAGECRPVLLENAWARSRPHRDADAAIPTIAMRLRAPTAAAGGVASIRALIAFLGTLPVTLYRITTILRQFNIQYINVHYPGVSCFVFALLRRTRLFRGKLVLSFHGSDARAAANLHGLSRSVYDWSLRNADTIVTVSHELARAIAACTRGTEAKLTVVYNGIELETFRSAFDATNVSRPMKPNRIAICVSSFDLKKGVDILLHAFAEVAPKMLDVKLLIVGESGDDDDALMALADQLGVSSRVEWRRNVSEKEVAAFLAAADVFVLPSRNEGFPLALLEAGAAGLPVVATRVGGVPELISHGDNGLLVAPEDPAAMAAALQRLLDDPASAQMGARLRQAVELFTWNATYRGYARLLG